MLEAEFFFEPMLSRKTFATNSLVQNFLQDVWFGRNANYFPRSKVHLMIPIVVQMPSLYVSLFVEISLSSVAAAHDITKEGAVHIRS